MSLLNLSKNSYFSNSLIEEDTTKTEFPGALFVILRVITIFLLDQVERQSWAFKTGGNNQGHCLSQETKRYPSTLPLLLQYSLEQARPNNTLWLRDPCKHERNEIHVTSTILDFINHQSSRDCFKTSTFMIFRTTKSILSCVNQNTG